MKAPPPSGDAHPAWVFNSSKTVTSHGKTTTYSTIAVSDSDGTDLSHVYTAPVGGSASVAPSWAPSGGSLSFTEGLSLKALDVSVSGGVASGSNVRTIYTIPTSDNLTFRDQVWCPVASVNKIAYIAWKNEENAIYLVSASGGTPTKIYSIPHGNQNDPTNGNLYGLTWSNDGTKLAFNEGLFTSPQTWAIKVIDLSGAIQATLLPGSLYAMTPLDWSNSGMDKIAFGLLNSSGTADLYKIGTTTGSTPTLLVTGVHKGRQPFWSPNNYEILYAVNGPVVPTFDTYKVVVTTGATTYLGRDLQYGDWKTP